VLPDRHGHTSNQLLALLRLEQKLSLEQNGLLHLEQKLSFSRNLLYIVDLQHLACFFQARSIIQQLLNLYGLLDIIQTTFAMSVINKLCSGQKKMQNMVPNTLNAKILSLDTQH
jgi:hypothetical protein